MTAALPIRQPPALPPAERARRYRHAEAEMRKQGFDRAADLYGALAEQAEKAAAEEQPR